MRAATPLTTEIKSAPCYYTASFHQRGTFLPKERQNDARQNILSQNYSNDECKHKVRVHGKFKLHVCHCVQL